MNKTNHRWSLFKHWGNVSFLGAVGFAGVVFGWPALVFGLAVEGAALWVLPDVAMVRHALEQDNRLDRIEKERLYYVEKLFGVTPEALGIKEFFMNSEIDWAKLLKGIKSANADYWKDSERWFNHLLGADTLVRRRRVKQEAETFIRLVRMGRDLRKLASIKPETVTPSHISRVEAGINQYLTLTYMARTAEVRLSKLDRGKLIKQLQTAKNLPSSSRQARVVRAERIKLLKQRVEELPTLEHKAGLAHAQAESVILSIEAFLDQARSAGAGSTLALDGLVDQYSLTEGYFDQVAIQQEVFGDGSDEDSDLEAIEQGLGLRKTTSPDSENDLLMVQVEIEAEVSAGH